MAEKPKTKSVFTGRWRIVSTSAWEDDYLDEEVQAFIEFDEKGGGSFQFGYVQGQIDYRTTKREEKPAVEFSWEGGDACRRHANPRGNLSGTVRSCHIEREAFAGGGCLKAVGGDGVEP